MPRIVLTNKIRRIIDSRYADGERVSAICKSLGVKRKTVSSYLHRTEQSRPCNDWKGEELELLKQLYRLGERYKSIALQLGRSATAVSRRVSILIHIGELQCRSKRGRKRVCDIR